MRALLVFALMTCRIAAAQTADPAYTVLSRAYESLRASEYEAAIDAFREAARLSAARPDIRKDLAYTLLKTGEREAARDEFSEAVRLDPADSHAALEYAFLCYETGMEREARLTFQRFLDHHDPALRSTAATAFHNIDTPLKQGIERWTQAVEMEPGNHGAHLELARLAERRDEIQLAALHYEKAWQLKPERREALLELGRVWKWMGRHENSHAALLAASRSVEARVAETARALLPARYPYVYEFRRALEMDPGNAELHRELAYLLLEMGEKERAEEEFGHVLESAPEDHLSAAQLGFLRMARKDFASARPLLDMALSSPDQELADRVRSALGLPQTLKRRPDAPRRQVSLQARQLAERSLEKGYMKDAYRYLSVAHEHDPLDFDILRKLGWTANILHRDEEAADWFAMAGRAPDPLIAAEARQAYRNLRPGVGRVRNTVWLLPFYSSRWNSAFSYGQFKTEFRAKSLPLRPYLSLRFAGDSRGAVRAPYPQHLSEGALIFGLGVATPARHGLMAWAEAGTSVSYRSPVDGGTGGTRPDYRGGVSYSKGFGSPMGGERGGCFAENHEDGVFVSRFDNSFLIYTQNRAGYTLPAWRGLRAQLYWNANLTADVKGQYWANFVETGPGARFRWPGLPPSLVFSVDVVRGVHTINRGNPRSPNFNDVRAGFWYAFTR